MQELFQRFSTSERMTRLTAIAVVFAVYCVYALMLLWATPFPHEPFDSGPLHFPVLGPLATIALCAAVALPILFLRRRPSAVFGAVLAESVLSDVYGARTFILDFVLVILISYLASRRPRVAAAGSVVAVAVGYADDKYIRSIAFGLDVSANAGKYLLAFAIAWVFGYAYRKRLEYIDALHEQSAARAVMAERLRIARELHDSVAHSIGIITVLSGAASRVVETKPAQARQALAGIESTSRETLVGLQRMLGALRRAEPDDTTPHSAPLAPASTLADVPRLAERAADAGLRVQVTWEGERRQLPPEIELSAFRIIQESVTNVVRHSGARTCRVAVGYEPEGVSIEVVDDGDDGPGHTGHTGHTGHAGRAPHGGGSGFGLVGIRERVALLSGQFSAGHRPEGGFRVTARIPA